MRRLLGIITLACAGALLVATPAAGSFPAQGNFGINNFDVAFTDPEDEGAMVTAAGTHRFSFTISIGANLDGEGNPEGRLRDLFFEQIPGLVADTTAVKRCTTLEFLEIEDGINACPLESAIGITANSTSEPGLWTTTPVFNLAPPPGVLLRLGFRVANTVNIVVDAGLSPSPPYKPIATSRNTPQLVDVYANKTQLWGVPSSPAYDELRGICGAYGPVSLEPGDIAGFHFEGQGKSCPVEEQAEPLLTLPTSCSEPLESVYEAISWEGDFDAGSVLTHNAAGDPQAFTGCSVLTFDPTISAMPTGRAASSPTGLDFSLEIEDEGLTANDGRAKPHIRRAVVTLPEGMTANPSLAEGLDVCTEAELASETLGSAPGDGCPQASKIGTIEVRSPLIDEAVAGSLYQAAPHANLAGDSLIAFYIVLRNPRLGIIVKQPVRVEPDAETGQLVAITEEIPQVPFSSFRLRFREGGRSPLVTPPLCGTYETTAELTPWSGSPPYTSSSTFGIVSGPGGSDCPPGGTPPFRPGFEAGSSNNAAGAYSPFSMRLTRRDGDQDLTRFDATLPPGVVARLAGVSRCPDAQIALAETKTGRAELASPSCPLNSRIGTIQAGAGVGSQLTYVPGAVYLAGPFGGAPLSAVGVVPAVAGPFDVGTVVVRQALRINPRTAEVTADGASSDPLPHILAGIPLVVRDIQVHVDRSGFTLNPTSCDHFATKASIWGGGGNPFSVLDNRSVARSARYQAASCASLGFEPRLALSLKGGTRRGAHPALRGVFRPRPGDANLEGLVLRLPRSAFLDQAHIRTICTRVQFAAAGGNGAGCPEGSIYGRARAFTPLLDEPLEGPVYLRSSNHNLPDFVAALHGLIDVEAVARIDSKRGGIRATFTEVPDAPISRVVVDMQGAKKGLIVNSTNLCARKRRADARLTAHNAKRRTLRPLVRPSCKNGKR